ncbi:hypothetical protein B0O99DRAFT_669770 [Bisporella sp. PMI_857]|nr:hypothetical protein B0O99DRAFT_669770 [Bisporella sp. PMI_857]
MDPLSVTASVIAVATLAWQSCKAACDLIDGLAEAPQTIAKSKNSLVETQKTLGALQQMLTAASEPVGVFNSVLGMIELDETLESAKRLCDEFTALITGFTNHSTKEKELGDCQRTISMVLVSINLIVTTRTTDDIQRLGDRFQAQEQALAELDTQLRNHQTSLALEEGSASDRDASMQLTAGLRKVCQETLSATRAKRTGQSFGDMSTDDQSFAMQGIVGEAHDGVEQSFGKMTTSKNSRAFQGQIDAASFTAMFGKR